MDNFNLEVNDRVEVLSDEKIYKALIIDVKEDFLRINLPVSDGEYLMLNSGQKIEMSSYINESNCFSFYAEVLSRGKEANIIYYSLSKPFEITRIQRRNFFRVAVVKEIQYKIISNVDESDIDKIAYKYGLMVDLSAGGLKFKLKDKLKDDDLILINLKLDKLEAEIKCGIVRIETTEDKQYLYGLRFIDISPVLSEGIIGELFTIVRKQRAKS